MNTTPTLTRRDREILSMHYKAATIRIKDGNAWDGKRFIGDVASLKAEVDDIRHMYSGMPYKVSR